MEYDILSSINDILASVRQWEWSNTLALGLAIIALFIGVAALTVALGSQQAALQARRAVTFDERFSVSYTHLTLPTRSCQCRSRWSAYH